MTGRLAACYLCGLRQPKEATEIVLYRVPSAQRGGTIKGVNRYIRRCSIGCGCNAGPSHG